MLNKGYRQDLERGTVKKLNALVGVVVSGASFSRAAAIVVALNQMARVNVLDAETETSWTDLAVAATAGDRVTVRAVSVVSFRHYSLK